MGTDGLCGSDWSDESDGSEGWSTAGPGFDSGGGRWLLARL